MRLALTFPGMDQWVEIISDKGIIQYHCPEWEEPELSQSILNTMKVEQLADGKTYPAGNNE